MWQGLQKASPWLAGAGALSMLASPMLSREVEQEPEPGMMEGLWNKAKDAVGMGQKEAQDEDEFGVGNALGVGAGLGAAGYGGHQALKAHQAAQNPQAMARALETIIPMREQNLADDMEMKGKHETRQKAYQSMVPEFQESADSAGKRMSRQAAAFTQAAEQAGMSPKQIAAYQKMFETGELGPTAHRFLKEDPRTMALNEFTEASKDKAYAQGRAAEMQSNANLNAEMGKARGNSARQLTDDLIGNRRALDDASGLAKKLLTKRNLLGLLGASGLGLAGMSAFG